MSFYLVLGISFISCFILSLTMYTFLINRNSMIRLKKSNDKGERWASQSKPIFGGLVFYIIFILALIFVVVNYDIAPKTIIGILISISLAFIMGFYDDTKNTHPLIKFVVQFAISIILIVSGIHIGISQNPIINYSFTIFWVVALMNSLNMLDNMDAITASVSAIILAGILGVVLLSSNITQPLAIIIVSVAAAIIAFLFWNWSPSKLYMGDNGSQFIGAFLAIFTIIFLWNNKIDRNIDSYNMKELLIVALAFIVPFSDTTTVTINRLLVGKSPFVGDRNHTTHNLSYLGLSERMVAVTLIFISLLGNALAIYIICYIPNFTQFHIILYGGIVLFIFLLLFSTTKIPKKKT